MKSRLSEDEFAVLVARSGLTLNAEQRRDIHDVFGLIEAMCDRVHAPLPRAAEPGLVFRAGAA